MRDRRHRRKHPGEWRSCGGFKNRKTIAQPLQDVPAIGLWDDGVRLTIDTGTDRGLEHDHLSVENARALRDWLNHYLEWQAQGPEPEEVPE